VSSLTRQRPRKPKPPPRREAEVEAMIDVEFDGVIAMPTRAEAVRRLVQIGPKADPPTQRLAPVKAKGRKSDE
jgi:hypothetical protein